MPTQFESGFLAGLLVGEGHFGGDGRQPHVTLRMHVRHEPIFRWLERTFPGGRVYGPYNHDGRRYFQWMARGPFLRDELVPLLDRVLSPSLDRHSFDRFQLMKEHYPQLTGEPEAHDQTVPAPPARPPQTAPAPPAPPRRAASRQAASRQAASQPADREPADLGELFSQLRDAWP
jgi:hypothetical protein